MQREIPFGEDFEVPDNNVDPPPGPLPAPPPPFLLQRQLRQHRRLEMQGKRRMPHVPLLPEAVDPALRASIGV